MWVRSAVFDPRMLCSILKGRFFWDTLYNNLVCLHLSLRRNPVVRRSIFTTRVLGDEVKVVVCPAFADSISEGDLRWEKAVGDTVSEDEVLCEIETDKTSVPVPSPGSGVITRAAGG